MTDSDIAEDLLEIARLCGDPRVSARIGVVAARAAREKKRHEVEILSMRDILQNELTDREANSARVVERQQVLSDRCAEKQRGSSIDSVAFERAAAAAAAIEEAMCDLEVNPVRPREECVRLATLCRPNDM
jgi:hypothetical protein